MHLVTFNDVQKNDLALAYFCAQIIEKQKPIIKDKEVFFKDNDAPFNPLKNIAQLSKAFNQFKPDVLWNFSQNTVQINIFPSPITNDEEFSLKNVSISSQSLEKALCLAIFQFTYPAGAQISNELFANLGF